MLQWEVVPLFALIGREPRFVVTEKNRSAGRKSNNRSHDGAKLSLGKNLDFKKFMCEKHIWGLRSLLKCVRIFVHDAEPEKITYDQSLALPIIVSF